MQLHMNIFSWDGSLAHGAHIQDKYYAQQTQSIETKRQTWQRWQIAILAASCGTNGFFSGKFDTRPYMVPIEC
jgi:hypothetical protein